jgi:hypothetical protein
MDDGFSAVIGFIQEEAGFVISVEMYVSSRLGR